MFVDDAPLDLDCTFSVRTSPNSKHAYFLLDHDVPADQLRDLARRAAYALGADKSGWNSQQIVRVPGTFNAKPNTMGASLWNCRPKVANAIPWNSYAPCGQP